MASSGPQKRAAACEQDEGGAGPLDFLKLSSFKPLHAMSKRVTCATCGGKRKWFCYSCARFLGDDYHKAFPEELDSAPLQCPQVKLPVKVAIVHYPGELRSKSTAVHGPILSQDIEMHEYPCSQKFTKEDGWVCLSCTTSY